MSEVKKSFKEIMAEKAAAKAAATVPTPAPVSAPVQQATTQPATEAAKPMSKLEQIRAANAAKAAALNGTAVQAKPADLMAAIDGGTSTEVVETKLDTPIARPDPVPVKPVSASIVQPATKPVSATEDTKDSQEYADIKGRIEALAALDVDNLKDAMKDLKAALRDNPAACALMLPEEIGEMVSALRRLTQEDIVEASKPAKERKAKTKVLTAEEMAAAFDEL